MTRSRVRRETLRGQVAAEFAIAFPLFILIILGTFEFAFYWGTRIPVANGARNGARYAATHPTSFDSGNPAAGASIQGQVQSRSGNITIANANIGIDYYDVTGATRRQCGTYASGSVQLLGPYRVGGGKYGECVIAGNLIEVTVRYNYSPITPVILPIAGTVTQVADSIEEQ